jgi:PKD repeat protein
VNDSTITATVPNPPSGFAFTTQPCTVGSVTGTQKIPTVVNVNVTNLDTTCVGTLRNGFLLFPPGADAFGNGPCQVTQPPPTPPVASFTSQALAAPPHTMQFIDTSTGSPTSWSWTFFGTAGPATSTQQNPVQTFPGTGTFNVKLTVTNAAGSSTITQAVTVP